MAEILSADIHTAASSYELIFVLAAPLGIDVVGIIASGFVSYGSVFDRPFNMTLAIEQWHVRHERKWENGGYLLSWEHRCYISYVRLTHVVKYMHEGGTALLVEQKFGGQRGSRWRLFAA